MTPQELAELMELSQRFQKGRVDSEHIKRLSGLLDNLNKEQEKHLDKNKPSKPY
ncbi:hypothetical protein J7384_11445 [Endozoicomonas sp. G2_1]|uniref:hypothetical protein n=1 Tax=Endozoicomonas sp. G2_1 TaxID=2821091 RepID=UPI001ADB900D|nr:hypothetical protein [Endozoicomonas sp. G2_1]MBO9490974.1 hypothetical protein [Endozoicomonas sp. G2_1]